MEGKRSRLSRSKKVKQNQRDSDDGFNPKKYFVMFVKTLKVKHIFSLFVFTLSSN